MRDKIKRHPIYFKILSAFVGMAIFVALPTMVNDAVNTFAPISWWVKIEAIEVSDIDVDTAEQSITILRTVRREINGSPRQELHLYSQDRIGGPELLSTTPPATPADYERTVDGRQSLGTDWWIKKGIDDELRAILEVGEVYQWVWVIEFQRPNGTTEIKRYPSNSFTAVN